MHRNDKVSIPVYSGVSNSPIGSYPSLFARFPWCPEPFAGEGDSRME
jgi:hypothetical protein